MMIDLLTIAPPFAADILERTSSTVRVQHIVQISMAPAFLLAGIGAIMNVLVNRMIWIANRIERIDARIEDGRSDPEQDDSITIERDWLENRRHLAQMAVMCGTGSAAIISLVIALLFISAWITTQIGTLIAICWITAMVLLIIGLAYFFRETRLATIGARPPRVRERRRWRADRKSQEKSD